MAVIKNNSARNYFSLNGTRFPLLAFEGGMISAEIVKENRDNGLPTGKHLGAIQYGDFIFETLLYSELTNIIRRAWKGENERFSGTLITTDFNSRVIFEDIFQDSLLAETIIPPCDTASKATALLKVRLRLGKIENHPGDGSMIEGKVKQKQTAMLRSNFRFELGKLPCSRVVAIDSFSVLSEALHKSPENIDNIKKGVNSIDFPNLFLTISSADLKPWMEWQKNFIIDGKNNQADELSGRLVFLAPNLKDELFAISMQGVGIFSLQHNMAGEDNFSRFRVGLYCESMVVEGKND